MPAPFKPDFAARRRAIWGDRIFLMTKWRRSGWMNSMKKKDELLS